MDGEEKQQNSVVSFNMNITISCVREDAVYSLCCLTPPNLVHAVKMSSIPCVPIE